MSVSKFRHWSGKKTPFLFIYDLLKYAILAIAIRDFLKSFRCVSMATSDVIVLQTNGFFDKSLSELVLTYFLLPVTNRLPNYRFLRRSLSFIEVDTSLRLFRVHTKVFYDGDFPLS